MGTPPPPPPTAALSLHVQSRDVVLQVLGLAAQPLQVSGALRDLDSQVRDLPEPEQKGGGKRSLKHPRTEESTMMRMTRKAHLLLSVRAAVTLSISVWGK